MVFVAVMLLIVELRERENDNDRLEAEKEDLKNQVTELTKGKDNSESAN
jgi:hypothetical protein